MFDMGINDETILSIGMISLSIGILIGRFTSYEVSGFSISDFVEGTLTGVSLAIYLYYFVKKWRK